MKKTIVDQIEITKDGHIQIRMRKQIVDGNAVFDLGFHRTSIECGGNVEAQMNAVNAHLANMGLGPVHDDEIDQIKSHAALAFTPEKIAAHKKRIEDAMKALAKEHDSKAP